MIFVGFNKFPDDLLRQWLKVANLRSDVQIAEARARGMKGATLGGGSHQLDLLQIHVGF